jgi:hypothetical protein
LIHLTHIIGLSAKIFDYATGYWQNNFEGSSEYFKGCYEQIVNKEFLEEKDIFKYKVI